MPLTANLHPKYTADTVKLLAGQLKQAIEALYEVGEVRCDMDICCAEYYAAEHLLEYYTTEIEPHVANDCDNLTLEEADTGTCGCA